METKTDSAAIACASCRYAGRQETSGTLLVGRNTLACRRYPPQIASAGGAGGVQVFPVWVPVAPSDWCGEHVPRVAS